MSVINGRCWQLPGEARPKAIAVNELLCGAIAATTSYYVHLH